MLKKLSEIKRQPLQRLGLDDHGTVRFKHNALVRWLVDNSPAGLNGLSRLDNMPLEDWVQLAQLIGYSLSGFGELPYVSDGDYEAAAQTQFTDDPLDAWVITLQAKLDSVRTALRPGISALYGIHEDDLYGMGQRRGDEDGIRDDPAGSSVEDPKGAG